MNEGRNRSWKASPTRRRILSLHHHVNPNLNINLSLIFTFIFFSPSFRDDIHSSFIGDSVQNPSHLHSDLEDTFLPLSSFLYVLRFDRFLCPKLFFLGHRDPVTIFTYHPPSASEVSLQRLFLNLLLRFSRFRLATRSAYCHFALAERSITSSTFISFLIGLFRGLKN